MQLSAELGARLVLTSGQGRAASVIPSPDGTASPSSAVPKAAISYELFLRPFAQPQPTAVAGTDGATIRSSRPTDNGSRFFADGKLKKVAVTGGPVATICDAPAGAARPGAPMGRSCSRRTRRRGAHARADGGGDPQPLDALADGDVTHRWPQVLPGSRAVLTPRTATPSASTTARIVVAGDPERHAEDIVARRLLRPLPAERTSRLHARRDALRRAVRSRTPGNCRRRAADHRERRQQRGHRRRGDRVLDQRHARLRARPDHHGNRADPWADQSNA